MTVTPLDAYIFTAMLVESMGIKLDREKLDALVREVARGELTLVGTLEEEIAKSPSPEFTGYLRHLYAAPRELRTLLDHHRCVAEQIAKEMQ